MNSATEHKIPAEAINDLSLADHFESACQKFSQLPAFSCAGHEMSFSQLEVNSRSLSAFLQKKLHVERGARIAIQLPNIPAYPIAAWASIRLGAILVNTNPMYTERELVHQLNDSGASVLLAPARILPILRQALPQTGVKHVILVNLPGDDATGSDPHLSASVDYFEHAIGFGQTCSFEKPHLTSDDVIALQYTGGTTGVSKGAVLTHGNLYSAVQQVDETVGTFEQGREVFLAPLPLYHIYGFNSHVIGNVLRGGLSILIPDPRNVDTLIAAFTRFPITALPGINTLFASLLMHQEFHDLQFSTLKLCTAGGAALLHDLAIKWERATGCCMTEGYGLSETSGVATFNVPGRQRLGTIGQPVSATRVKVVDSDGKEVATGSEGELLIKGPQVMRGYWNQEVATQEAFDSDGWFRTGDIAVLQHDGYIKLVDRKKDMVIVSGFNVYPNEVENVVSGHPEIHECAAVGIPDARSGEAVMLYAVKANQYLTEDELKAFCRLHLTAYKVPRHIKFVDELPKTNVGKILRRQLRELTH